MKTGTYNLFNHECPATFRFGRIFTPYFCVLIRHDVWKDLMPLPSPWVKVGKGSGRGD